MRRIALSLALLLSTMAGAMPAAAFELPYKVFYDELKKFEARPNTDRLALRSSLRAKDRDRALGPVEMRIITRGGPVPIAVDEDNAFQLPMNPEWVEQGAVIDVNKDPDSFEIRVQVGMKLPDQRQFTVRDVQAAFDQFDKVIEEEVGLLSFAAPSARRLRVMCGQGCTATLAGPKGDRVLRADEGGRVNIVLDKALKRENPRVTLSHPARWTSISTKD